MSTILTDNLSDVKVGNTEVLMKRQVQAEHTTCIPEYQVIKKHTNNFLQSCMI